MIRYPVLARAAVLAFLAGSAPAFADSYGDYANAMLGEHMRRDRSHADWRDLVARPSRYAGTRAPGPKSWTANDENPWANTYGTPQASNWRTTTLQPWSSGIVRMCSCYLPAEARSWDGGPLTEADITRLCRAQCY